MRRILLAALSAVACTAPPIAVATAQGDAAGDVDAPAVDAPACVRTVKAPEGGVCEGADEDGDCVPDACDDCPNVPQRAPIASSGTARAGDACIYPRVPFAAATRRVAFEPFATAERWTSLPVSLPLRVADGALLLERGRVAYSQETHSAADVVATAVFVVADGGASMGIVLRYAPDTGLGWVCALESNTIQLLDVRCTADGFCSSEALREPGGNRIEKQLPLPLWSGRIVLRAAVAGTATGALLECQAFLAPSVAEVSGTLQSTSTSSTLRAEVSSPLYVAGAVGLFAPIKEIEVESIDVLASP